VTGPLKTVASLLCAISVKELVDRMSHVLVEGNEKLAVGLEKAQGGKR
jgi:hypothetical protein